MTTTIDDVLNRTIKEHLSKMRSVPNGHLHGMVMGAVEKSLLKMVISETEGNQSDASRILGINRNTLRKKIKEYRLEV